MLTDLIDTAKEQFRADYAEDKNLDVEIVAFEEGMKTAFRLMFEQSLYGSITFDLVVNSDPPTI